jgi:site-specific recombinase XerD
VFSEDVGTERPAFFVEKTQFLKSSQLQSGTPVGHVLRGHVPRGFLPVARVAELLGLSKKTILRWCESGKLVATPKAYGKKTTYLVSPAAVELLMLEEEKARTPVVSRNPKCPTPSITSSLPHSEFITPWITAMEKGLITGRPFSPVTIRDYEHYAQEFLASHPAVSPSALETELLKTSVAQYGKRFKMYKAVVCFAKYLIRERALDKAFLHEIKHLYPKRHLPPKRLGVDEAQFKQLMAAANTPFRRMMLVVLAGTGLRVSEAVALKCSDVDFERRMLIVRLGKSNKTRPIGLSSVVLSAMAEQMEAVKSPWVFSDEEGQQLTRMGLYHRLKRLGETAGVKVSPHALRRAFVTLNVNKGRPLVHLQIACGHSDIKTTRSYCLTTEQEVVEAMKRWD